MASQIAVIGAGEMGHGIAELAALNGFSVRMTDIKQEFIDRGMERIRASLGKLVKNRRITEAQSAAALERIRPTLELREAVRAADVVIEAILEDLDLKKNLFAEIDGLAPPHAILASNTSGLSITAMGRATKRPDRVVGMHFFNPAVLMPLIEVVKGDDTSAKTFHEAQGFDAGRVLGPVMHGAAGLVEAKVANGEEIDEAVGLGTAFPLGPLALGDALRLHVVLAALRGSPRPAPTKIREGMVARGDLGE